jgi:hypothetical protein
MRPVAVDIILKKTKWWIQGSELREKKNPKVAFRESCEASKIRKIKVDQEDSAECLSTIEC